MKYQDIQSQELMWNLTQELVNQDLDRIVEERLQQRETQQVSPSEMDIR
jgi:hypothetical protein